MKLKPEKIKEIEFCQKNGDPKAEWYIDALHIINQLGGLQLEGVEKGMKIPAAGKVENYCAKNGICYGILSVIKGWNGTMALNKEGWQYLKEKLDYSRYQKAIEMKNITEEEIQIKTNELIGGQYE